MNAEASKKVESFLGLLVLFVLTIGVVIANGLTLAIEPFCRDFGLLCTAGFFKLMLIGLGISTAFTVVSAFILYMLSLSWEKQDDVQEIRGEWP